MSLTQGYPNKKRSYIASQGDLKMHSDCISHFFAYRFIGFLPFPYPTVVALLIYSAFFGQDLFLPTLPAVTPITRSYRTDSGEVLGDDMGVSDTYYCHAHSLCGECQGQLVCHSPPTYLGCYQ